ncbi:protoporphyrinogen/coproporphyrinogen oxidase [Microbacterium sp. R86528]|uniref:protoporphyrinogen/coproporphyrinogen oxidase n=1 Tax=Microbacterium sp. R86528 TaxID=3093864 RepID=UPI0037C5DA8B
MSEFSVVGGGIAGLVTARRLAASGASVTLFEASARLGGTVAAHNVGGIRLDAGAESFAVRGGAVSALAHELGLADDIVSPRPGPAWLQRANDTAVPLPATSLLGVPGDVLSADVVSIIGMDAATRAAALDGTPTPAVVADMTLGRLVRERMGDDVLAGLVAPVVRGVHSIHPDDLPIDRAHPRLRATLAETNSLAAAVTQLRAAAPPGSAVAGIRGGITRLVSALTEDLTARGVQIMLNYPVTDISALPGRVIVAAPGFSAAGIATTGAAGREITLITLVVDQPELDAAPRGSGLLVADGAAVSARALTHATAKWEWLREAAAGRHVLRLSFDTPPVDGADTARRDAESLLGIALPEIIDSAVVTWTRPAPASALAGTPVVGETVAGSGLAGIIAHAERTATEIIPARG